MAGKNKAQVKKEFSEFAVKIAELESLRQELNALDVKGFESEAGLIKAKLKDVNAIPQIKNSLAALREKIYRRAAARHIPRTSPKLLKETEALERDTRLLKDKIASLQKVIEEKRRVSVRKQLSSQEVEYVRDIPKLESELNGLRREFAGHKNIKIDSGVGVLVNNKFDDFISEIKGELTERLKEREGAADARLKADLETQEKILAQKYKSLVNELHERYKKKVREGLHEEIKANFDDELNKKLAEEERRINRKLISEDARKLHDERMRLVSRLESSYSNKKRKLADKIKRELSSRIAELNKMRRGLKARQKASVNLSEKERALIRGISAEMKRKEVRLADKKRELKEAEKAIFETERKNDLDFAKKVEAMKKKMHNELIMRAQKVKVRDQRKVSSIVSAKESDLRTQLDKEYKRKVAAGVMKKRAQLNAKRAGLDKIREKLEIRQKKAGEKLLKKERALINKVSAEMRKKEEKLADKRRELREAERAVEETEKKDNLDFAKKVEAMKKKMHNELIRRTKAVKSRNEKRVSDIVSAKENDLRIGLEKEYQEKAAAEIRKKQAQLEAKKRELEQHVLEQARKMFR